MMMTRRVAPWLLACVLTATTVWAQPRYAGRPLADVLRDLQARGLNVVFSSELVKPEMRVAVEPKAAAPRQILDEVLKPHALRVAKGAKGALLVVRAGRKAPEPEGAPRRTGSIHGTVIDKRTGTPLPGVTVSVQGTSLTTVTGEDGGFVLGGVPAEPQSLFVSLIGYGLARPLVNVDPDRTADITIGLADGLGSYSEEVTVVADRFRGADSAVPSQHTLTSADMQDLRGVIADDPLRAVQVLPGVATGDDFRSEFSVRASDFRHIGLSFDGIPIGWLVHLTRGLQDTGSVSIVNGDVIEGATLLSGPYPQRAPGRTGAWLSFDLQEGSRTAIEGHLSVSSTTASISLNGPIGSSQRGSWLVSARQSYLQWVLRRLNPSGGSAFGFSDIASKLTYDVTPRQKLRFSLLAGRSELDQNDVNPGPNAVGMAVNRTSVASLGWQWMFDRALLTQKVALLRGDFTNTGQFGQLSGFGSESSGWYVVDLRAGLGRGVSFSTGGTLQRNRMSQTLRQFSFGAAASSTVLRREDTLSQAAWTTVGHAGLAWQNQAGATVDAGVGVSRSSDVEQTPISGWALGAWPVGRGLSVRVGASLSWQFPDLPQLAGYGGVEPVRAERGVSFDAGLEQRLSPNVRWQVTFFTRDESNVFRLDDSEARLIGDTIVGAVPSPSWRNALAGYARGVEVMVQRRAATGVAGWISYSYGHARYTDRARDESFWADFDQRHALNAYALVRFSSKTSLSGKIRFGTNFPIAGYFEHAGSTLVLGRERNTERLPTYARLDLRLNHAFTYTKRRLTLFVEVINVLGHTNYGPTDGAVRSNGQVSSFTEKLFPFLPSVGFTFDF